MDSDAPLAFSYVRFSTPEQDRGDSYRRQYDKAVAYAERHGLVLSTVSYSDLGVSGFRGSNATGGALSRFIEAVERGDIPSGSFLLIENLDRFSRLPTGEALQLLYRVCSLGISVVTLSDGHVFTKEKLDLDTSSLLIAILVAHRAHDESRQKASRLADVWEQKRRKAAEKPLTKTAPAWLKLRDERDRYEAIPERAEVVRRIFRGALDGRGQHAIAEGLNADAVPVFGDSKFWHRSYVKKILESRTVIGEYQPHKMAFAIGSETKRVRVPDGPAVPGYYPAIIATEDFERLQVRQMEKRQTASGNVRKVTSLLAGLARCPICGQTMTRVSKGPTGGKTYYVCTLAKSGAILEEGGSRKACVLRSVPLEAVEDALCSKSDFWLSDVPFGEESHQVRYEEFEARYFGNQETISRLLEDLEANGSSRTLSSRLRKLEAEQETLEANMEELRAKMALTATNVVKSRLQKLRVELQRDPMDLLRANTALRECLASVVIDWPQGVLRLNWLHGGQSDVIYGWPIDDPGADATLVRSYGYEL